MPGALTNRRNPKPRMVDRICENPACACSFQARAADVARGQGRFCSKACAKVKPLPAPLAKDPPPPDLDARKVIERLAQGVEYENCGTFVCAACGEPAYKPHAQDCIVLQARQLLGIE